MDKAVPFLGGEIAGKPGMSLSGGRSSWFWLGELAFEVRLSLGELQQKLALKEGSGLAHVLSGEECALRG